MKKRNDRCGLSHMHGQERVQDLLADGHVAFVILTRIFPNEPDSPIVEIVPLILLGGWSTMPRSITTAFDVTLMSQMLYFSKCSLGH